MKKPKERTKEETLKFISDNFDLIEEGALSKVIININSNLLEKYLGFYPQNNRFLGTYLFDYESTLEYNISRFNVWLEKNFDSDKEWFMYYVHNSSLFYSYYLNKLNTGEKHQFNISDIKRSASNLFFFLRGIIIGKFDNDYTEANELESAFKNSGYNQKDIVIGNQTLSIKSFANGRLDIKGLNDTQLTLINKLISEKKHSFLNPDWRNDWSYSN